MKVSEHFYSVQGEGFSVGVPAYFFRLQGCNICCGGPNGALMKAGKATWYCDSETVWRQGTDMTNTDLIQVLKTAEVYERICSGEIHCIWTGGEPCLPSHQEAIVSFMEALKEQADADDIQFSPYNEVETNGTIKMLPRFFNLLDQINCSAKLANSGMGRSMRVKPEVIQQIISHKFGTFKFVVSTEEDIEEIERDYIQPNNIPKDRVCIMPGVDNREDLPERTEFLFNMTKKYGYRGITRNHILAWGRVTGV